MQNVQLSRRTHLTSELRLLLLNEISTTKRVFPLNVSRSIQFALILPLEIAYSHKYVFVVEP